jgi:predicted dehydrogenase
MVKQDKVRGALVGIGSWSAVIANAVQRSNKLEMATCYTRDPEKRAAFSRKYGCDHDKSVEDILKRADVDGVLLTTPNAVHAEHALSAARCGKLVYVEKPIANTMSDGKKMVEACREAGVALLVGHDMRRLSGFRRMKELFDKGKDAPETIPLPIGDPILEEVDEFADCIRTGRRPETDGEAALAALALVRAAIESAQTDAPVDLKSL